MIECQNCIVLLGIACEITTTISDYNPRGRPKESRIPRGTPKVEHILFPMQLDNYHDPNATKFGV